MFVSKLVHFNMPSLNSQHSSKAEHCNFEKKNLQPHHSNLLLSLKSSTGGSSKVHLAILYGNAWSYIISRKPFKAQHACLSCPVKKGQSGAAFMAWFMLLLLPLQQCQLAQLHHHHAQCSVIKFLRHTVQYIIFFWFAKARFCDRD